VEIDEGLGFLKSLCNARNAGTDVLGTVYSPLIYTLYTWILEFMKKYTDDPEIVMWVELGLK
jgi:hypothetical protein